jgi:metallo-beta-lactamase family protein
MCDGGRIVHHLKHNLWRSGAHVVFVGFQGRGTLGRALVDGAPRVHVLGEEVVVNAKIHTLGGFSAHADQQGLLSWLANFVEPRPATVLVHGEEEERTALAELARARLGIESLLPEQDSWLEVPRSGTRFELHGEHLKLAGSG